MQFNDKTSALERLEDTSLDLTTVRAIYLQFKGDTEVEGQVAMNLSRRTSIYEPEKSAHPVMTELLVALSESTDMGTRWAVAKNPHTPVEVLKKLAKDEVNLVRALVATNPHTPPEILQTLFSDEKIVRDGLSGNPSTPAKLLDILADDSDKMVRMRVAENPATPIDTLERLLKDTDHNVAKAAEVHRMKREKHT